MSRKDTITPSDFATLLADVKGRIQAAQTRAVLAVNAELVRLYWDIGRLIHKRQEREGWGAAVIPRLSAELRNELSELKGFSERNIGRMIAFARAYPQPAEFLPQAVAKLPSAKKLPQAVAKITGPEKVPQPVAQLAVDSLLWRVPWGHHACLLEKVKGPAARRWYMEQTLAHGWSRNVLTLQIKAQTHARHSKAVTNFHQLLPSPQSDLAQQTLKDPYIFDFLTLAEPFHERQLETGLLAHLERFLIELGQGFAFVGRQYRVGVGNEDFYIDLLFYHLRLRCFIVIDLKRGAFKAEYAGKMNFYLNLVDDRMRHASDTPTIGLILCQDRNRVVAEYALRGLHTPIGVSEYELTRALPQELESSLPSIEAIEDELTTSPSGSKPARRQKTSTTKKTAKPTKRKGGPK